MLKTKRYGEYKIVDLLGKGAYGVVYLAKKDDLHYAIKCIDKDKIIEDNLEDSIKTEISLMRMIRHPYIVKMSNSMTTQQKIILVMENVEGGDLFEYIVNQPDKKLSEETSRLFFQQMIMALEYCHNLKVVHRDLKPENILIDKTKNCIKISDFGLSTLLKNKDEMIQNACGTPNYLAPEVMKQTGGYLGQAADIWSAGVILYNMVTGKNPFHNADQNVLLKNILNGHAEYPKYLSKPLIDLLSKIFVPQPRSRYTIEQIKEHPWFQIDFKPVIGYLKENTHEINYVEEIDEKSGFSSSKKKMERVFETIKSNNFILDFKNVPIINCFELSSMLAGKWISKMFEPDPERQIIIDYDRFSYEFTCEMKVELFIKQFETNFSKLCKSITYITTDYGKYTIEAKVDDSLNHTIEQLVINFLVYKITEVKIIFSLYLKEGNKFLYLKLMHDFCEQNKFNFKLF